MSSPTEEFHKDTHLDVALRPKRWDDYIGQERIKKNLNILLKAARGRKHAPEHLLFYGLPGLGKTTLAHLVAIELDSPIKPTSGPAIERVGDLASILTNLEDKTVLFIDEIHRLNKPVEEALYPALESGMLDIVIGKGPSARTIQLELPAFTLVGATTRMALLSSPLRSRFSGGVHKLEFYNEEELAKILERSAKILNINADKKTLLEIAKRSRFTPRTANFLLKRARDYAQVHGQKKLDGDTVEKTFNLLEIDEVGLSASDRLVLKTLIEKFDGGPVGVGTLATATHEEASTVEDVYEPYLIQLGFLERTPRGRVATSRAYKHLGKKTPGDIQDKLI